MCSLRWNLEVCHHWPRGQGRRRASLEWRVERYGVGGGLLGVVPLDCATVDAANSAAPAMTSAIRGVPIADIIIVRCGVGRGGRW